MLKVYQKSRAYIEDIASSLAENMIYIILPEYLINHIQLLPKPL